MVAPIRMPQPGQMTEECTVLQWFKQEGDAIKKGEPLFEIETDKSNMEIEAFDEGTLLRIDVTEGQTVPVDAIIAWIGQPGEEIPAPEPNSAPAVSSVEGSADTEAISPSPGDQIGASPSQLEAFSDAGARHTATATSETTGEPATTRHEADSQRLRISPRASRLAAETGVDPRTVVGTGPMGRIVERDVRAAAGAGETPAVEVAAAASAPAPSAAAPASPAVAAAPSPAGPAAPSAEAGPGGDGEPLSRLRRVIARRLTESVTTIPRFTVTVAVDMTDLVGLRARIRDHSAVNVTDFIHAATVQSLMDHPLVNSRTDGQRLWRRERVHLGVAVSVPGGLLVSVVRDAQLLSVSGLHDHAVAAIAGARAGSLGPDDLSGSTFTVSNMGMFGVEQFEAIINPGESGILAVSSVQPEPRVLGDGIAIRQMMRITLSADHRLVDGELGARFVNAIKDRLEDVATFASQV